MSSVLVGFVVSALFCWAYSNAFLHHRRMDNGPFLSRAVVIATAPSTGTAGSTGRGDPSSTRSRRVTRCRSTIEKHDERMTTQDEEILFGKDHNGSRAANGVKSPVERTDLLGTTIPVLDLLDQAQDPMINKLTAMRSALRSCPDMWKQLNEICPEYRALLDEHLCDHPVDVTFAEMYQLVLKSAAVFADLGVQKGRTVAVLGENSAHWLMVDHGIQMAGGASAVRGADAPLDELRYIYEHSDSAGVVVLQGPKLLDRLAKDAKAKNLPGLGLWNREYGPVKAVILLNKEKASDEQIASWSKSLGVRIAAFEDLLAAASPIAESRLPTLNRDDLATIVYTSGTTGHPKGVMLTHGNLLHQTGHRIAPTQPYQDSEPVPGEVMVSLLPVWHITERAFELWMATRGCSVVYSSIRTFKNDLAKHRPQWMVLVPRVLEKVATGVQDKFASASPAVRALVRLFTAVGHTITKHRKIGRGLVLGDRAPSEVERLCSWAIVTSLAPLHALGHELVWKKVQDGFGGRLKVIISGGSALAGALENFYEIAGFNVCVGYGLTECSPLLAYRRSDDNLVAAGCVGKACSDTELRVVDPDSRPSGHHPIPALPDGQVGVVLAKGPQVMKGYYKNQEATDQAIDKFGWLNTGDLGRINPATGDLVLTGRAKDTIVLSNGENVEPQPIEDSILSESSLIDQVMLTGQDGRRLVAVTVLNPNELGIRGYVDAKTALELQTAHDKVNDPKCTPEECAQGSLILNEVAGRLREDRALKQALTDEMHRATVNFRKWEQVGDVYILLEPFAMSNGLLTQSYKVKRAVVERRYADHIPK